MFLGTASVATGRRSSRRTPSIFIHCPSVWHAYVTPSALESLGLNLGSTRAVCRRCSPYCNLRLLSAKTK
jgi:hypothetical protein